MESQPQNPEFRINPETFHPCSTVQSFLTHLIITDLDITHSCCYQFFFGHVILKRNYRSFSYNSFAKLFLYNTIHLSGIFLPF